MWYFCTEFNSDVMVNGKTVVITGGNTGIGKETAKDLYKRGARVLILSRDQTKSKNAIDEIKNEIKQLNEQHDIITKRLDLSDLSSVRSCAEEILREENQINILINNAGLMGHYGTLSKDGFEMHFATNYLGHFLLTNLLMPRIINSAPARIINVSSLVHKFLMTSKRFEIHEVRTPKRWLCQVQGYARSKIAQILFTKELHRKLKDIGIDNVTTYSLHPGVVATELGRSYDNILWGLSWLWHKTSGWLLLTPKQGAKTTLYCALNEKLSEQSGLYYSNCAEDTVNEFANSQELAKELWDQSIEFTEYNNVQWWTR